jgi:hypothetical protein
MTYSYALLNESSYMGSTYYSQAVEIHLAVSPTGMATSQPSGQSWCAGDATTCGAETVLFHSAEVSTSPPTFSSHEVSNIWEVPNYPPGGSTTTWFAVHLNYWIVPPMTIPNSIMNSGCLVVVRRQARRPTSRGPRNPASSRPPAATSRPTSA